MKLTEEQLKNLIKEELESLVEEQESEQTVERAIELKDRPKVQQIFDKMENDPEIQKAKMQRCRIPTS